MSYNTNQTTAELWAVLDHAGNVLWTRGGSNTQPRLMVYASEKKALAALRSPWTIQVHGGRPTRVEKIYEVER